MRWSAWLRGWTTGSVRAEWAAFFEAKGYSAIPSSPVLPASKEEQHSLVFVNAGMNQLKSRLLGDPASPFARLRLATNSQKCIRTKDLPLVGRDGTHLTFFEMLGSWRLDQSAEEGREAAFREAWELLRRFRLPEDRLVVTYFGGDEALGLPEDRLTRDVWLSLGLPSAQIQARPAEDNFWEMGRVGPCGPCTEIHFCHPSKGPPTLDSAVELWNLVLMERERLGETEFRALPSLHVDTGCGLERLTTVLQDGASVFDTDAFGPLLERAAGLVGGAGYSGAFGNTAAGLRDAGLRLLADHARLSTVALTDGVPIRKKGPYFLLRRCIRRAAFAAQLLRPAPRLDAAVMRPMAEAVVEGLGDAFPELRERQARVLAALHREESGFLARLKPQINGFFAARSIRPDLTPVQHFAPLPSAQRPSDEIIRQLHTAWSTE